jgi:hypothetical protein
MTAVAAGMPNGRISTITQVTGAIERLRRAGWPLAALWAVLCVFSLGMQAMAKAIGLPIAAAALTPAYLAYATATTAVSSVLAALGLRLLVRGRAGWLTIDRPVLVAGALMGSLSLALVLVSAAYTSAMTKAAGTAAALAPALMIMVGYVVLFYVALKLTLWPIGILMGRPDMTPARSWRLMKKATRGLVLGYIVFAIPLVGVMAVGMRFAMAQMAQGQLNVYSAAIQVAAIAFSVCGMALTATIYELRVKAPASVAEVF